MTEDELTKLEDEVFAETVPDPDMERDWLVLQREICRKNEQQLMAMFRLSKFLRDDLQITSAHANLMKARKSLVYIEKRIAELNT